MLRGIMPKIVRFKQDLGAAGIPYMDAKSEHADFHALRKTTGAQFFEWLEADGGQ
ncbi:MAG: hypothetical protein WCN98_06140 [Verrucomicrobiaceae bacterium]